ncbi:putative zinc-binding protein [uncultured Aquitalea sp.]|uniref:putative zinc-binding protein n=1 Tax=uncultured Aquitalea sp. TaxID=540272 RepID=UPI0025EBAF39|nr:putative zinc-binding protein [uncultured Aquitalea sp.]
MNPADLPLVYACSGCSSAAQMANDMALRLTREGLAEMSCIAGVGGQVPALVRVALSGRPILALDGCRLACVASCLQGVGVRADAQVQLAEWGVMKRKHCDYDPAQAESLWPKVCATARQLKHRATDRSED